MENGGPAPESITDKIYENTKTMYLTFLNDDTLIFSSFILLNHMVFYGLFY